MKGTTMNASTLNTNREQIVSVQNGWLCLPMLILLELASIAGFIYSIATSDQNGGHPNWVFFILSFLGIIAFAISFAGFFTLQLKGKVWRSHPTPNTVRATKFLFAFEI